MAGTTFHDATPMDMTACRQCQGYLVGGEGDRWCSHCGLPESAVLEQEVKAQDRPSPLRSAIDTLRAVLQPGREAQDVAERQEALELMARAEAEEQASVSPPTLEPTPEVKRGPGRPKKNPTVE